MSCTKPVSTFSTVPSMSMFENDSAWGYSSSSLQAACACSCFIDPYGAVAAMSTGLGTYGGSSGSFAGRDPFFGSFASTLIWCLSLLCSIVACSETNTFPQVAHGYCGDGAAG